MPTIDLGRAVEKAPAADDEPSALELAIAAAAQAELEALNLRLQEKQRGAAVRRDWPKGGRPRVVGGYVKLW